MKTDEEIKVRGYSQEKAFGKKGDVLLQKFEFRTLTLTPFPASALCLASTLVAKTGTAPIEK